MSGLSNREKYASLSLIGTLTRCNMQCLQPEDSEKKTHNLNDSMRITWKNITEVEQIQSGLLNIFIPIHESKRVGQLATNGGNSFLAFELRNEFITIPNNHNPIPCCSNIS